MQGGRKSQHGLGILSQYPQGNLSQHFGGRTSQRPGSQPEDLHEFSGAMAGDSDVFFVGLLSKDLAKVAEVMAITII